MKSIIKKYFPKNLKIILSQFINRESSSYSLRSKLFPPSNLSDFFVWSPDFECVNFIAENIYAFLNRKDNHISVTHVFRFYSPEGNFIKEYKYDSSEVLSEIKIPFITDKYKYISFTHYTSSINSVEEILVKNGLDKNLKVTKQSRGYSLYVTKNSPVSCAVHGNFGGISPCNIEIAKQRSTHIYTPVYKFEKESTYHLVFNNPTKNDLKIKALYISNTNKIKEIKIPPMGTKFISVTDYSGGISFESKLPICRPIIFKNPPPNDVGFDVMHG